MKRVFCIAAVLAGIGMIAIGIAQGQPDSVMAKAVQICLECIGIG